MRGMALAFVILGMGLAGAILPARADEGGVRHKPLRLHGAAAPASRHCGIDDLCPAGCPDGYSCAPLYGAYGPYGGVRYWGAYTWSGWGRR
jgi:hypothetical protein